ncbi:unnamed protein product [Sphagnum balticum]
MMFPLKNDMDDFGEQNSKLLVCGTSKRAEIYTVPNWAAAPVWSSNAFSNDIITCKWAPDGSFATGDNKAEVRYFTSTNALSWTYSASPSSISFNSLDFSPDSKTLIVGDRSNNNNIFVFKVAVGISSVVIINDNQQVWGIAYSKDGLLYCAAGDSKISHLYNGSASSLTSQLFSLSGPTDDGFCAVFTYNSEYLAVGSKDKNIYIYKKNCNPANSSNVSCPSETYYNSTACRLCALDMPGCRLCNVSTLCYECTQQYYRDSTKLCQLCSQIIPGCDLCSSASVCRSCLPTYYLSAPSTCSLCWSAIDGSATTSPQQPTPAPSVLPSKVIAKSVPIPPVSPVLWVSTLIPLTTVSPVAQLKAALSAPPQTFVLPVSPLTTSTVPAAVLAQMAVIPASIRSNAPAAPSATDLLSLRVPAVWPAAVTYLAARTANRLGYARPVSPVTISVLLAV